VQIAHQKTCSIKLETLEGISKTKKQAKSFRYSLNSWSFYQLQKMIECKAKLQGIPVVYIDPTYTSQTCSKCGHKGNRNGKGFMCPSCGHVENADVNAAFNIARRPSLEEGISQFGTDRDVSKGSTDPPKEATPRTRATLEPPAPSGRGVGQS